MNRDPEKQEKTDIDESNNLKVEPNEANSDPAVKALDADEADLTNRIAFGTNMSYGRRNGRITYEFNGQWDNYSGLCAAGRGWLYQDLYNHSNTGLVCKNYPSAPAVLRFDQR
jgi:hypothetical protein